MEEAEKRDDKHRDPWPNSLFDIEIPDAGRAVARLSMTSTNLYQGHDAGASGVFAFNIAMEVGQSAAKAVGQNVCPGTRSTQKGLLGFGVLTNDSSHVSVRANSYVGWCADGEIQIDAGAVLEVWVEDPSADCVGKDIQFKALGTTKFTWSPGIYENIIASPIEVRKSVDRREVLVLSSTQVNATPTVNLCGAETEFFSVRTMVNGSAEKQRSEFFAAVAFAEGLVNQTHAIASDEAKLSLSSLPETFPVQLQGAISTRRRTTITSGDFGDAQMAVIQF